MSTKEAQRAAHQAWQKRLKDSGGVRFAVSFTAEGLQALNALTEGDNRKRSQAINAALIAAAKAAQKPMTGFMATLTPEQKEAALAYRGDDTHGDPEFAAQKPVEPSKPAKASKLDTSAVMVHPSLKKEKPDGR